MRQSVPAYLILKNIPHREWSYLIDDHCRSMGRSTEADIRVPDHFESVSRRHAKIWCDRKGMWICDVGSRAGTHINGVWVDHVPQARFIIGDTIGLGKASFEVVPEVAELANTPLPLNMPSPTWLGSTQDTSLFHQIIMARTLAQTLSPAEIEVLLWLGRGIQGDIEVGQLLHRSPNTVRTQIGNINRKLSLHSRAELLGWVRRANFAPGSAAIAAP